MAKPKILFFDIETSPNLAYIWGKYEQDAIAFEAEWQILSVAWKWQGDPKVNCVTMEGDADDKFVTQRLYCLLQEADVVVAHNGDDFDLKKARARMIAHNLPALKTLSTVDTLKIARTQFKFNSNKLDDLCKHLKIGKKGKTSGFELWLGCMKNEPKSWAKMVRYNKQDVVILERLYDRLKPWIKNHPSLALLNGNKKSCPNCGKTRVVKNGLRATTVGVQQRMDCLSCGAKYTVRVTK